MIDELIGKIEKMGNPSVVGLDPTYEMMPGYLKHDMFEKYGKTPEAVAGMFLWFNQCIIDAICDVVPAVKLQIAMYEKYGVPGMQAYINTIKYARSCGLTVIGDIKRGDISSTAENYAAHIGGTEIEGEHFDVWGEDFITVNPYFGTDGIKPFTDAADKAGRGIFVLVKTSNPSSCELQDLVCGKDAIYETVAARVMSWGSGSIGRYGYSNVGAVVGATHPRQGQELRQFMKNVFFLVPGYGAQGATAKELAGYFDRDGRGCIVNSSRGIIAAYKKSEKYGDKDFAEAACEAALDMKRDLEGIM